MVRRLTAMTAVLLLAFTVAACGGDDDDGGGEALSEAEFVEQANKICADGEAELDEQQPDSENPSPEEIEEYIDDVLVPNVQDQLDAIGELNPPEEIADDVDAMLEEAESALDEVGDMSAEEIMSTEEDPFTASNELAAELGLDECGS